jgi:hypothetical protein
MDIDRNPAPVIGDSYRVIRVYYYLGACAIAFHGLVNSVIDDFIDKMMQASSIRAADIHTGTFAHGLEAVQYADILCTIAFRAVVQIIVAVFLYHITEISYSFVFIQGELIFEPDGPRSACSSKYCISALTIY